VGLKYAVLRYSGVAVVLLSGAVLRLWNLGYSDYQGDEIKALYRPDPGQGLWSFLLDQRKGPVQFVTTYLVHFFDRDFSSGLLERLPFAIAGVVSLWFFYRFVAMHFDDRVALLATGLYATNGMIVALSRLVQYQAMMMLFTALALYFFSKALFDDRYRLSGWLLGAAAWALGVLAHFDGMLILPFVLYIAIQYFLKYKSIRPVVLSGVVFSAIVLSFYGPYAVALSHSTVNYWEDRFVGDPDKLQSSAYLFKIYNPLYTYQLYIALTALGLVCMAFAFWKRRDLLRNTFLLLWLAGVVIFFEVVMSEPGTHILNYQIPLTILMAFGVSTVLGVLGDLDVAAGKVLKSVALVAVAAVFAVLVVQSYAVYVDHTREYPYQSERLLGRALPTVDPDSDYELRIFGFPYNRGWQEIREYVSKDPTKRIYATNDKDTIAVFYLSPNEDGDRDEIGYFVWVNDPQSFDSERPTGRVARWMRTHKPNLTVERRGKVASEVYKIPESWGQ
jgi:4-amino-4-deoxy-L-arabinose transferase-like glycosyltransferase